MKLIFLKKKQFWLRTTLFSTIFVLSFVFIANLLVSRQAMNTFSKIDTIEYNEVGLLLGTSKFLSNGTVNSYYQYRIDATIELFNAKKIKYILISGDNGSKGYDEPTMMKNDLINQDIPENIIYLDYAGFRTLDSVVRAKEIFGQKKITVISQQFHNERALYLADHFGIKAVGFNAKKVTANYAFKTSLREYFARCKMMLDILFGVQPKFLGDPIRIG